MELITKSQIIDFPTKVSEFTNDAGFITNSVNNLVNYYFKSETYTKTEVAALIGAIQQFHYEIYASTSEVTTPADNVLYLIGPASISGGDKYEEYVYANNTFVKIGDTSIDLSGYVTTSALNTALADYTTTANLTTLLSGKVDKVQGKGLSTEDYTTAEKNKLAGIATGAEVNVQSDWNQDDNSADDYIKNKPTIPVITGKADKVSGATSGNLAGLDANGNLTDSGSKPSDFATAAQGTLAATAVQPAAITNMVSSTTVRTIWTGTQLEYDSITTKDANTEYNIIESV